MLTLFLIRGLPGSGKSTLAKILGLSVFEADDFFMKDGAYHFDPSLLPQAHANCRYRVEESMGRGQSCVVSNTFTQRWEMEPYIQLASANNARLVVVDLFDGGCDVEVLAARNTHGVPLNAIARMRDRWEHDWKNANPSRAAYHEWNRANPHAPDLKVIPNRAV